MTTTKPTLQALADSGIPAAIGYFRPSEWPASISVPFTPNLKTHHAANFASLAEAEAWLTEMACKHYPESDFAKAIENTGDIKTATEAIEEAKREGTIPLEELGVELTNG